jgi:GNAT superfamily N-acetyltransferase
MIAYRKMTPDDIPAGLHLCRLAGWNQLARDWELFLRINNKGCRVGFDDDGNVVGTVTTIPYENHFAWIGMVLVDPSKRRQGIGTQLLREALQLTADHETIKLDATPDGRKVYLKSGFVDEYKIIRMRGRTITTGNVPPGARPLKANDFPSILKLDREVFGADRQSLLEWFFKDAQQYAFILEEQGRIHGFCLGRRGYDFDQIGPIIANDAKSATQLLWSALHQPVDRPIVVDVLTHIAAWITFVSSSGFAVLRPLIRMYRGPNNYPGVPAKQFAILGPEFG